MSEGFKVVKRFFHWGPFTAIGRCLLCETFSHFIIQCNSSSACQDSQIDVRLCVLRLCILSKLHIPFIIISQICLQNGFYYCSKLGWPFTIFHYEFPSSSIISLIYHILDILEPHVYKAHSLFSCQIM